MAEEKGFSAVVESLSTVTKKASAGKAKEVLAVQIVDKKGKPVEAEGGAGGAEKERDKLGREEKQLTLLERIANSITGKGKIEEGDEEGKKKGKGIGKLLAGGLTGGGAAKFLKGAIGPAALLGGLVLAIKDGFAGWFKSDEWGVSKIAGALGGLFGGTQGGTLKGVTGNALKWGLIGAGLGSFVPVIGTAIGGAVGALFGAILGWIGGKKIAKWFNAVGTWVSTKWDEIKAFPGKVWTGIVDTVKGWLGLGTEGTVKPIVVDEKDKPKKGWLASIVDFLIPQWLIDFAKDALGTVTGWLGLTKKDDQGKVTTTAFGKLIFGTVGSFANIALNFVKKFIPDFIIDFVAAPLDTIMTWIGLTEKDKKTGAVTTTAFGKELFGKVKKVGDILGDIIGRVIGEKTWTGIKKFVANPIDYVLIDMLGWKKSESEGGGATEAGKAAVKTMETGVLPTIALIIERIIGKPTFDAIKSFATDPVNYVLVNWLGWKKKGGELTTTGMEAMQKLEEGKIGAFWTQLLKKIIGKDTYDTIILFVKDPIDYIFTKWLGLKSKDDKKKSTGEKAGIIVGTVVGLWKSLLDAILPKGVVDFIMSPINWIFGLFGLKKPGDTLASVEEAHGLTIGPEETRTGLFGKMLSKILPKGLMKFFKNPLNWVLETLLGPEILAKITGGTYEEAQTVIKKSAISPGGLLNDILEKIIPKGLMDFIKNPIDYILKEFLNFTPSMPKELPAVKKISQEEMEAARLEARQKMIDAVVGGMPGWISWLPKSKDVVGWSVNQVLEVLGMAKGGPFSAGQPMLVGEMGPELIVPNQGGQVFNAQRTEAMMQANIQKSVDAMRQTSGQSSINVQTNSPVTTNVTQTQGRMSRAPIDAASGF